MNVDMTKIKESLVAYGEPAINAETVDTFAVNETHLHISRNGVNTGGLEMDFRNADGEIVFYIEVHHNEVWHFDWIH
jgi:hypothetical protein